MNVKIDLYIINKMLVPVLCFTCGKMIGDKWELFKNKCKNGTDMRKALDECGLNRYCCRNIFVCHKDLIYNIVKDNSIYYQKK